jgi:hypothetical protein
MLFALFCLLSKLFLFNFKAGGKLSLDIFGEFYYFARLRFEPSRYWKSLNMVFTEANFVLFGVAKNGDCVETPMGKFVRHARGID